MIANRGEIALRVIRSCRDMSIISVGVYSTADSEAMHALLADQSVCIGSARAKDSYLNKNSILQAACSLGVDAIHPGYGFLSEDVEFSRMCEQCGIVMIGPRPEAVELLGDKAKARATAKAAGCPVIPGSDGEISGLEEALQIAEKIGYPVMLKAVSGGGGRGIRMIETPEKLEKAYAAARMEAKECFGDDRVYIEKCILGPRHIEVQILADNFGNVVYMYERDCSLQRRHQKFLEECPSPILSDKLRTEMGEAAVKVARQANYTNAGTVEFLLDKDNRFYFMEMNTRIQVEHAITEQLTNKDIVRQQIRIAANLPLDFKQENVFMHGHVMELRINAEDPRRNFAPCPGTITALNIPGGIGVRADTAIYQGYTIPPFYDSMIAKLIISGRNRTEAIERAKRALAEFIIDGITTNIEFLKAVLDDEAFLAGRANVDFMESFDF